MTMAKKAVWQRAMSALGWSREEIDIVNFLLPRDAQAPLAHCHCEVCVAARGLGAVDRDVIPVIPVVTK
jgi:hypothetical protein